MSELSDVSPESRPGVNSGGPTDPQLEILRNRFGVVGKKTVICHSAGTDACLQTITSMKAEELTDVNFVFDSPRMEFGQFDEVIRSRGLSRDQVTVIGAVGDELHWPDPSALDQHPLEAYAFMQEYLDHAKYDYKLNPSPSYRCLFLEVDRTAMDNLNIPSLLGHGSMFEGEIADHRYDIWIDGEIVTNQTIAEAYRSGDGDEI